MYNYNFILAISIKAILVAIYIFYLIKEYQYPSRGYEGGGPEFASMIQMQNRKCYWYRFLKRTALLSLAIAFYFDIPQTFFALGFMVFSPAIRAIFFEPLNYFMDWHMQTATRPLTWIVFKKSWKQLRPI